MGKSRKELELEKKKLLLAITKANTAKEELDMKVLEAEVNVERMHKHQELQDEVIAQKNEELKDLEELIINYQEDSE